MNTISQTLTNKTSRSIIIDILAVAFIYLVPTISHLLSFPLYLADPMRLVLILAIVHSGKANAYILALSLPVFSMLISGHPVFPKMILISTELILNVFFFYLLMGLIKKSFPSILLSIVFCKLIYYLLKFIFINTGILNMEMISTPILYQAGAVVVFSLYVVIGMRNEK